MALPEVASRSLAERRALDRATGVQLSDRVFEIKERIPLTRFSDPSIPCMDRWKGHPIQDVRAWASHEPEWLSKLRLKQMLGPAEKKLAFIKT